DSESIHKVGGLLQQLNPLARQVVSANSNIELNTILQHSIDKPLISNPEYEHLADDHNTDRRSHIHSSGVQSVSIELLGSLNMDLFDTWMQTTLEQYRENLWRIKGI